MLRSSDLLDLVLEPQLALLEPRELELVAAGLAISAAISLVELAMLGAKLSSSTVRRVGSSSFIAPRP